MYANNLSPLLEDEMKAFLDGLIAWRRRAALTADHAEQLATIKYSYC